MIDIDLLRSDPERVRESQRRRFASVELVDEVIELDKAWCQYLREEINSSELKQKLRAAKLHLDTKLKLIGNLLHDSVPVDNDKEKCRVIRSWGDKRNDDNLKHHVHLTQALRLADIERGTAVAGGRGYYLRHYGSMLNEALLNFGLAFLVKRGYKPLRPPLFMKGGFMAQCAQLAQFDEELYKVGDNSYMIATSEQPLCAYHHGEAMEPKALPIRYAGVSPCFRKEAGSHGKDTLGIFRVHEFEKIEQFGITSPLGDESWKMHEEMLKNAEDFYQELGIPYRVVSIVSGDMNDSAAKKYDLEGWFPGSNKYLELVSCSNCTDYQARNLGIKYGKTEPEQFVHMLNSTLTATERTLCCIMENYQTEDGLRIPKALQRYMSGMDFIPLPKIDPT